MSKGVLDLPTLVLNRQWQPVHVTTVARSLILLWNDAARVVDPDEYRLFSWSDWALAPAGRRRALHPIRTAAAAGARDHHPGALRSPAEHGRHVQPRNVAKRDHYTCQYCGAQPGAESITIDHVLPRSQGGASSWTNCVAACERCNARKGDRTPDQAGMRLRRRPVRPEWKPFYAAQGARIESWARFLTHERVLAMA